MRVLREVFDTGDAEQRALVQSLAAEISRMVSDVRLRVLCCPFPGNHKDSARVYFPQDTAGFVYHVYALVPCITLNPQVSSSMFPGGEAALRLWLSLAVGLRERYGLPLLEALADLPQLMIRSIQEVRKKGGDLPIKPGGTCLPHYSFTTDPPKLSTPRLRSRPHSCAPSHIRSRPHSYASHICWACLPPRLPGCWFIPTGARRGDAREPDEA